MPLKDVERIYAQKIKSNRTAILATYRCYEFDGEKKTLIERCHELNIDYDAVRYLLNQGLSFEDAIDKVIARK